jgi:glycosyltransferase involved in cell wall biosynthesis
MSTPTLALRLWLLGKHLANLWNDLKLLRRYQRGSYDCLVVKDKFIAALYAIVAARWRGTKLVYWLSYPYPEVWLYNARQGLSRFPWLDQFRGRFTAFLLYRILLPQADHVFVQSERMKLDVSAQGIVPDRMTPVPMGVALDRMPCPYPVRQVRKPHPERWIVYLGTLTRARKLERLIGVLARVRKFVPDAVLYFLGSGYVDADEELLRNDAQRLGLGSAVRITGWLDCKLAWEYVALADVCVSPYFMTPTLQSTSPVKLVEYMALGRPVVASLHPEQEQVIRDSGAGLYVPYEEEDFAAAIVELLTHPQEAEQMGRRGRAWVEKHRNYDGIALAVEQELARVLAGADRGRRPAPPRLPEPSGLESEGTGPD